MRRLRYAANWAILRVISGLARIRGQYPVMCSWCQTHGRPAEIIRFVPYRHSHGICPACRDAIRAESASQPPKWWNGALRPAGAQKPATGLSAAEREALLSPWGQDA